MGESGSNLNVGLIGAGAIAKLHARVYKDLGYPVRVCTAMRKEHGRQFAASIGAEFVDSYEDVCAHPDVDYVDVCTFPDFRLQAVEACAKSHKHVQVQKPIATTLDIARRMVDAAESAGIRLGVVSQHRFDDSAQFLAAAIREGRLGKLLQCDAYVKWHRTDEYYARPVKGTWATEGGGALISQAIHQVDLLRWIAGPVDELFGMWQLEVAPFTLAPLITDVTSQQRSELRMMAADAGVTIIGLHWLLAKTEGFYLTSPEASVRARTAEYLVELATAAQQLGGELMVFGSPKQRSLLPGVSWEQAFDYAVDTFRRAMPGIADQDIHLCMEPLAPSETDFINTCAEDARLMEAVNHPNLVLHLDVKAMSSERIPMTDLIRQYVPRAGHFHANDPNMKGPGFGEVDFAPIFKALQDAGYERWVSVEVFDYTPDAQTIAQRSVEYMQSRLSLVSRS